MYMWISLGIVKVIHEFGHGLSCKAFGGECHQMGFLFMCFSPSHVLQRHRCLDAGQQMAAHHHQLRRHLRGTDDRRGVDVRLVVHAALAVRQQRRLVLDDACAASARSCSTPTRSCGSTATTSWPTGWKSPTCAKRRIAFWATSGGRTVPGHRSAAEQLTWRLWRKWLFAIYAVASWVYRWVITFSILYFLANWLKPYKLETVSYMLAAASLAVVADLLAAYRLVKNIKQRGRLPDMKTNRVKITCAVAVCCWPPFFSCRCRSTACARRAWCAHPGALRLSGHRSRPGGTAGRAIRPRRRHRQAGAVAGRFRNPQQAARPRPWRTRSTSSRRSG